MYYIYKIENQSNHKKYIGLTNNIQRRRARHFTDLRCGRHDNSFLQKEFNIYGEKNFTFNVEFSGDITPQEIGEKEREYIKKYDSYRNGYNQNEGGNFGPSNGGTHLTQSDIFNILSALEFMSRPGQVLSEIFEVSKTTISRIKNGINHVQYKEEYDALSLEERKNIYRIFCESTNFYEKKVNTTIIPTKRKLNEQKVHLILENEAQGRIIPIKWFVKRYNVNSYVIYSVLQGINYKDYIFTYGQITEDQRNTLVSLLRNWEKQTP